MSIGGTVFPYICNCCSCFGRGAAAHRAADGGVGRPDAGELGRAGGRGGRGTGDRGTARSPALQVHRLVLLLGQFGFCC